MTATWDTLIDTDTLADALVGCNIVIVDCRFSLAAAPAGPPDSLNAGEQSYRQSHLPGARYAHLSRDLSGPKAGAARGSGRHPWPDARAFCTTLGRWGVAPTTQVIAYDAGDGAFAARLWFLLQALGHRTVGVLDGGWARWTALGLPVDALLPTPVPTTYDAGFDNGLLLDSTRVQRHLDAGGLLVDARASERFRGESEPIDRVAGHVPGAINRAYADNLVDGCFKPAAQLAREFDDVLAGRAPPDLVAMCGSGVTGCHHLLAMAHAGRPGARLFTGSWSGWIEDPARPVASQQPV